MSEGENATKTAEPIWVHNVTVDRLMDDAAGPSAVTGAVQITVLTEMEGQGPVERQICMPLSVWQDALTKLHSMA